MSHSSFPTRILCIVFFWIVEAARPAVENDESRNHRAAGGVSGHSYHGLNTEEADVEDSDEADEDGEQLESDSDTVSVSNNDSTTDTGATDNGFFKDLIQGHEQIKSAMAGYEDVVSKGEKRALAAYDKLGEFQNTIKNLTDPLRSLPKQVHDLRQNMVRTFEAQTRELENELKGATAELTKEDSGDSAEDGSEDATTTPQGDASNDDEVDKKPSSSDDGSSSTDTADGKASDDSQAEAVGSNNTSDEQPSA